MVARVQKYFHEKIKDLFLVGGGRGGEETDLLYFTFATGMVLGWCKQPGRKTRSDIFG